jgi:hypothetical protein
MIWYGKPCSNFGTTVSVDATPTDPDDTIDQLVVTASYTSSGTGGPSGPIRMGRDGDTFYGTFSAPTYTYGQAWDGGTLTIVFTVRDPAGNKASATRTVTVDPCIIIG